MIRTPQALIPYALAMACIAGGALWHLSDGPRAQGQVVTRGIARVGGPFVLVDQEGHRRTDADFRGRWMLVYFGYTHCPDVCPTTLALMAETMKDLGKQGNAVVPVFITLDPDHDSPKVLKAYLGAFGPGFVGLTGSENAIRRVAKAYRVYRVRRTLPGGRYSIDHSSVICLMGPDGRFVAVYDDSEKPEAIAADIRKRL